MKKRVISWIVCLLVVLALSVSAHAAQTLPMVVDQAGLLSQNEEALLESKARALGEQYKAHVVIVTADTLGGERAQDYADDFFDQNGYGYGSGKNGILFLLAMEEREWYISTCGDTVYAVTDYGVQQLGNAALDGGLSSGAYYSAFDAYLDAMEELFRAAASGSSIDGSADYSGDFYHGDREEVVYPSSKRKVNWLVAVGCGLAAGGIAVGCMALSMNTRRRQYGAASYIQEGSFHLNILQDLFLYSTVSKIRRPENTGGGHSGGGSSVHHSSGGRSHGGGGGKF